jgi:hypothetical protein
VRTLTAGLPAPADIARVMTYTEWLRRQVARLEHEIRSNPLLDSENPATPDQLHELRQTIVLHTYLKQQLLRRERVSIIGDEFVAVPASSFMQAG